MVELEFELIAEASWWCWWSRRAFLLLEHWFAVEYEKKIKV